MRVNPFITLMDGESLSDSSDYPEALLEEN